MERPMPMASPEHTPKRLRPNSWCSRKGVFARPTAELSQGGSTSHRGVQLSRSTGAVPIPPRRLVRVPGKCSSSSSQRGGGNTSRGRGAGLRRVDPGRSPVFRGQDRGEARRSWSTERVRPGTARGFKTGALYRPLHVHAKGPGSRRTSATWPRQIGRAPSHRMGRAMPPAPDAEHGHREASGNPLLEGDAWCRHPSARSTVTRTGRSLSSSFASSSSRIRGPGQGLGIQRWLFHRSPSGARKGLAAQC